MFGEGNGSGTHQIALECASPDEDCQRLVKTSFVKSFFSLVKVRITPTLYQGHAYNKDKI